MKMVNVYTQSLRHKAYKHLWKYTYLAFPTFNNLLDKL